MILISTEIYITVNCLINHGGISSFGFYFLFLSFFFFLRITFTDHLHGLIEKQWLIWELFVHCFTHTKLITVHACNLSPRGDKNKSKLRSLYQLKCLSKTDMRLLYNQIEELAYVSCFSHLFHETKTLNDQSPHIVSKHICVHKKMIIKKIKLN